MTPGPRAAAGVTQRARWPCSEGVPERGSLPRGGGDFTRSDGVGNVVAAVRGVLPGTWLPLQVRRGDSNIDLIVKFPPKS